MMTEYDIQRTAMTVVDLLLNDDRFISRLQKLSHHHTSRLVKTREAAHILGISVKLLRQAAPYIGGIKIGNGNNPYHFEEDGLKERYFNYCNNK